MPNKPTKLEAISNADLKTLIDESGLTVSEIEKGIKMPLTTLDKCLRAKADNRGYTRTLPTKWVAPLMQFIKERKAAKQELVIEVKEVLQDHNIAVVEPEISIPDEKRKMDWIEKLQEAKAEAV